jgi:hypothetical protein
VAHDRAPAPALRSAGRASAAGSAPGFLALRRPPTAQDALPTRALELLATHGPSPARGGLATLALSSARRLYPAGAPPSWLLEGSDDVCLLRAEPLAAGRRGYTLDCETLGAARAGYLLSTYSDMPGDPGTVLLEGLLPDGSRRARLLSAAGAVTPLPLVSGAYYTSEPAPATVLFELDGRPQAVPVPLER